MSGDGFLRVASVSGGKDSLVIYLLLLEEFGRDGFRAVMADTGHEHPVTLNFVRNISAITGGPEVEIVRADFADRLAKKGRAPTGSSFLDMMLWKGRAPSTKAQFCTEHLKLQPIRDWLVRNRGGLLPIMYVGIRAGESARRAQMPKEELNEYMDCLTKRPILDWTENQVFEFLKAQNISPNPLYAEGYSRVGCFPCIHARKGELARLPSWAWTKLESWERQVGRSWFGPNTVPGKPDGHISAISEVREWSKTSRGGRQFDFFAPDEKDVPSCMNTWGACE
jgi:3'-phosphoadenosine 5'-phosphosulfate sulfotransferase (PAPS reductase)/FAD synthetase